MPNQPTEQTPSIQWPNKPTEQTPALQQTRVAFADLDRPLGNAIGLIFKWTLASLIACGLVAAIPTIFVVAVAVAILAAGSD